MGLEVRDDPAEGRYELRLDGELAGVATYRLQDDRITFLHTEIEPGHEGGGLGGRLARGALDDARARGLAVVPLCPFVAGYVRRHADEYLELVTLAMRDRVMEAGPG